MKLLLYLFHVIALVMCDKCITSSKNDSEDKIECPKC